MKNELVQSDSGYMALISDAVSKSADVQSLERLMALKERWDAAQAKAAFNSAMSAFQAELPVIEKRGVVDFTSPKGRTYYEYARLEDIAHAIKPALKSSGLSYRFTQSQESSGVSVTCTVTHVAGHSESASISSSLDQSGGKDVIKAIASTISYLRRYTLTGLLGIVVGGEDDDAGSRDASNRQVSWVADHCDTYPDDQFNASFPQWSNAIKEGKKTPGQIIDYLSGKGVILSESQVKKINEVKNEKA